MKPKLGDASTEYVFLDVVSYSKRTIESQAAIIKTLNRIVLESARTQKLRRDRKSKSRNNLPHATCVVLLFDLNESAATIIREVPAL